jgi:hypothetical protein
MTTTVLPADEMLNLPAKQPTELPSDENTVVEQFIENSKNIVPGLQVSLARRVVMPGSKKVLCMAAHTSVPLNDDEVSSVSQLALRLSDGTSCLLSLQFFNDTTGSEYIPPTYSSFVYDPERYETAQGQSNLGVFLVATALCAIVCFYHVAKSNQNTTHAQWKPAVKATSVAPKPTTVKPAAKPASASANRTTEPYSGSSLKQASRTTVTKEHHASGAPHARAPQTVHGPSQSMFVPPPPPMVYTWPAPRQFNYQQIDPSTIQGFPMQPPAQITPVQASAPAKPVQKVKPAPPETQSVKSAPTTSPVRAEIKNEPTPVQKTVASELHLQLPPTSNRNTVQVGAPVILNPSNSAPQPGDENSIQLERIVLPNQ